MAGYVRQDFDSGKDGFLLPNRVRIGIAPRRVELETGNQTATRLFSFPVATGNRTFATLEGAQTFTDQITLAAALRITAVTNQLVLGAGPNTMTINAAAASGARAYSIPDPGSDANFIMSTSTTLQTIAGLALTISATTFTVPATVTYASAGSVVKAGVGALTLSNASAATLSFAGTGTVTAPTGTYTLAGLSLGNVFTVAQTFAATNNYTSAGSIVKAGVGALTLSNASAATLSFAGTGTVTAPTGTYTLAGLSLGNTFTAIQTINNAALALAGTGTAANLSIWAASNNLRIRGGTGGFSIDNTTGAAILTLTDGANAELVVGSPGGLGVHRFNTVALTTSTAAGISYWRLNINGVIRRIPTYNDA